MATTMDVLEEHLAMLESCCLHNPQWNIIEVEEVVAWYSESPDGYCSDHQVVLVKLINDLGYGVLTSCSDTTGHGCQCGSFTARGSTMQEVLDHLHEDEVALLLDPMRGTLAGEGIV